MEAGHQRPIGEQHRGSTEKKDGHCSGHPGSNVSQRYAELNVDMCAK